jgi:hypothetical protein
MTEDERRARVHAVAEVIDDFMDEAHSFVLVVFPRTEPATNATRIEFDVISSAQDRGYVATVLQHVVDGIERHEGFEEIPLPPEGSKPN